MRCTAFLLLSGIALACGVSGPAFAQAPGVIRPSPRDPYGDYIAEAAQRFQLPAAWIRAILAAESNGDARALSPKGAMGLMQIMPATWSDLRIRHRLGSDPYDPHDSIIAGAAYIRLLYDRYGSPGWIAAYNAGPGRYEASLKGRPLPSETRAYVATVAPNLDSAGPAPHCSCSFLIGSPIADRLPSPCRPSVRRAMLRRRPSCAMSPPSCRSRMACSSRGQTAERRNERAGSCSHDSAFQRVMGGAKGEHRQHDRRMAR